jgi:hypothetical protein
VFQQAVSALSITDQTAYELNGGAFSVYGFEYQPGTDNAVRFLSHAEDLSDRVSGSTSLGYRTTSQLGRY